MSQNFRQTDQLLRAIADAPIIADRAEINRLVTAYVQTVEPCLQAPRSTARALATSQPVFAWHSDDTGSQWLEGAVVVVAISLLLGIGAVALFWMQPSDGPPVGGTPVVRSPPIPSTPSTGAARSATPNAHEIPRVLGASLPRTERAHAAPTRANAAVLAPLRPRRKALVQRVRATAHLDAGQLHPPKLEISDDCKNRPLADNCAQ
jgi:hypothetical protein